MNDLKTMPTNGMELTVEHSKIPAVNPEMMIQWQENHPEEVASFDTLLPALYQNEVVQMCLLST
jgi:hypothetical protein